MAKKLIRNPLNFFWNGLFLPLLGWLFVVPLALIVPRRKKRMVLWGRDRGEFSDNVKYLYLHLFLASPQDFEFYFLTENESVSEQLSQKRMPVLLYPSLHSIWMLLRSSVVVTDSDVWINKFRYHLLFPAFKVQLWHGVGLKTIGLDNPQIKELLRHPIMRIYYGLKGKLVRYDLLITTGDGFTERGYVTGMNKKRIEPAGYPRNDVFFTDFKGYERIGVDEAACTRIEAFKREGGKVAAYLPTFRDSGKDAVSNKILDIGVLDGFCREHRLLMIFKFHSWGMIRDPETKEAISRAQNVIIYDNSRDIYPVLPQVDVMISDYSSVYMDFLLLDRPILFFAYDLEEYMKNERDFYFSYDELTPGMKCADQNELLQGLKRCISGDDGFSPQRGILARKAFNDHDGRASVRILKCIEDGAEKG